MCQSFCSFPMRHGQTPDSRRDSGSIAPGENRNRKSKRASRQNRGRRRRRRREFAAYEFVNNSSIRFFFFLFFLKPVFHPKLFKVSHHHQPPSTSRLRGVLVFHHSKFQTIDQYRDARTIAQTITGNLNPKIKPKKTNLGRRRYLPPHSRCFTVTDHAAKRKGRRISSVYSK